MAPYRPNGQSRRSGARGYVDHDFFEGLPVRHWRRTTVQVGVPPKPESSSRLLQPELPLPREANLLSPMSRALLQAARAGTINKSTPAEEETIVKEGEDEEDDEERGFVACRWGVVPKHLEGPEPEYLAKKRKGLEPKPPVGGTGAGAGGGAVKKAKIRRTDAEGNACVEEVAITEGHAVEGEVIAEVPIADAVVPGTVPEGVGAVNPDGAVVTTESVQPTPPRRRPLPPRRKPRGPVKGRKKKVQFVPGAEGVEGANARGVAPLATDSSSAENRQQLGESTLSRVEAEGGFGHDDGDTEMIDDSNIRDGDDDDDDEEGDEGDDGDREEGELTPSPTPDDMISSANVDPPKFPEPSTTLSQSTVPSLVHPLPSRPDVRVPVADIVQRSASSSPDLPLAAGQRSDPYIRNEKDEAPDSAPAGRDITALFEDHSPTPVQEDLTQNDPAPEDLPPEDPPPVDLALVDLSPVDLAPADLAPADISPADLTPADLTPADPTPADLTPADLAPADLAPADLASADLALADLAPVDLAPVDLPPESLQSEGLAPVDTAPENLPPEDLVLVDPLQESLPQEDLVMGNSVQEDLPQESLPQEDSPQGAVPQRGLHQDIPPGEDLIQEDTIQADLLRDDPPQEPQVLEDLVPLPQGDEPDEAEKEAIPPVDITALPTDTTAAVTVTEAIEASDEVHFPDGDIDLFGSLEKHLAEHSSTLAAAENSPTIENLDDTIWKEEAREGEAN